MGLSIILLVVCSLESNCGKQNSRKTQKSNNSFSFSFLLKVSKLAFGSGYILSC